MRSDIYFKGGDTTELANNLMGFLMEHDFVNVPEGCGFVEISSAKCDFEIHVIRKR